VEGLEFLERHHQHEQFKHRVAQFQPMFVRYCPHLLDEMRGLAEGAGVTLEEAMACSIRGELAGAPTEAVRYLRDARVRPGQGCPAGPDGGARR
jgi:hypothetical protein